MPPCRVKSGVSSGIIEAPRTSESIVPVSQRPTPHTAQTEKRFAASEYLLWTVGCFWPNTSPASPTFWCDMLLTLAILGLLPATRKAVDA